MLQTQGRILTGTTPFTGSGEFRFALVNTDASSVFWGNAPDGDSDGIPDASVSVSVAGGLYTVLLGDASLPNMAPVPASVFNQSAVFLRTWFDDGAHGLQRLAPDRRVAPVGYAMMAATVPDGSVTESKLDPALQASLATISGQVASVSLPAMPTVSSLAQDAALTALGYAPFMSVPAPAWSNGAPGSPDAPGPRRGHSGVWTGSAFIVWGGDPGSGSTDSGAIYHPDTDAWEPLAPLPTRPSARTGHSAVWTGSEMIVWGGAGGGSFRDTGSRLIPSPQAWTTMPVGPAGRDRHVAVWTGSRMVVWGGRNAEGLLAEGSVFNPGSPGGSWTSLGVASPPTARQQATGVWTGTRLIVWGGIGTTGVLGDGGRLLFSDPQTPQSWAAVSTDGAPSPRYGHSAIWTGSRMLVWGGVGPDGVQLADGGAYNPDSNTWAPLPAAGAPSARQDHSALWTGTEMLILAGAGGSGATATGAAYDPVRGAWRTLSTGGSPVARSLAVAVWTGAEIEIFGGEAGGSLVGSLQRLVPQPTWYFYRKP